MDVVAVVLGAGRGVRLGPETPKAQRRLARRSLLSWSASALGRAAGVDAVLPVVAGGAVVEARAELGGSWSGPAVLLDPVVGGSTRQESLARGLVALEAQAPAAGWVLVHDAARCLVEPGDAETVLAAARETGAAVPVVPLEDTVKEVDGARVVSTPDRRRLARALTPQAFRLAILREALGCAERAGFEATDCASLVERRGVEVRTCPGRAESFKVTHPADLERAERLLLARLARDGPEPVRWSSSDPGGAEPGARQARPGERR